MVPGQSDDPRASLTVDSLLQSYLNHLYYDLARLPEFATRNDQYIALARTVRDRLVQRWMNTLRTYVESGQRMVCYFSAEYLPGPHLANNLLNLKATDATAEALMQEGLHLSEMIDYEEEPGLGNGGLGRLASCYMDSLATLDIPAIGYGIRYEFGIFDQAIRDGWQTEVTDKWLRQGNPWELRRTSARVRLGFGGRTEQYTDAAGNYRVRWIPQTELWGVPYDTPIPGYGANRVNTLRLWSAEAAESFDLTRFNTGDYYGAVRDRVGTETISKILYPNDSTESGRQLRLSQQYFFVTCSLQDMLRLHETQDRPVDRFHEHFAIQLNDTHPAIAVAELIRLLVDKYELSWEEAWYVTTQTCSYTNHTLLPEALEKWPVTLFANLLPRHLEIIYEINRRFLDEVRAHWPGDESRLQRMSIIDESGPRYVRMGHLSVIGGAKVNGVAELHSRLVREQLFPDFAELWPDKFLNVTNGVTPRRFIAVSNPRLGQLLNESVGDGWLRDLTLLRRLEPLANDPALQDKWRGVKQAAKEDLASIILRRTGVPVDTTSLFDIQVKRIHEYKRQHLNILHIITQYHRLKANPSMAFTPRTVIFGGKAAPGYFMAKLIIKLIHSVADVVNRDPDVAGRLKVVFLPDFNVKLAQHIYPAADLSEQISTAGKEASGTGNMKFSMNGALTIGTLDGANIEIREEVGADNFFLFGLTSEQVAETLHRGYWPRAYYNANRELREAIDALTSGRFSRGDTQLFRPLAQSLLDSDPYLLFADYQAYLETQDLVSATYRDEFAWTRMSILNTARMSKFSSDRSVVDYCRDIWCTHSQRVDLLYRP
jgi:starch phosphorylase